MKKYVLLLSVLLITSVKAECINQTDYVSHFKLMDNDKKISFDIKKKDSSTFKVLKSINNKDVEMTGFYFVKDNSLNYLPEFKNPRKLNIDELIAANERKELSTLVTDVSSYWIPDIVTPVKWEKVKEITINQDISNLKILNLKFNIEKIIFYTVLIQGNQGECAYFESDVKTYDFKTKRIIK